MYFLNGPSPNIMLVPAIFLAQRRTHTAICNFAKLTERHNFNIHRPPFPLSRRPVIKFIFAGIDRGKGRNGRQMTAVFASKMEIQCRISWTHVVDIVSPIVAPRISLRPHKTADLHRVVPFILHYLNSPVFFKTHTRSAL